MEVFMFCEGGEVGEAGGVMEEMGEVVWFFWLKSFQISKLSNRVE